MLRGKSKSLYLSKREDTTNTEKLDKKSHDNLIDRLYSKEFHKIKDKSCYNNSSKLDNNLRPDVHKMDREIRISKMSTNRTQVGKSFHSNKFKARNEPNSLHSVNYNFTEIDSDLESKLIKENKI